MSAATATTTAFTGKTFRKIVATRYSADFRAATAIVSATFPAELRPSEVLVKNVFLGINASDINFTAGVYQPDVRPPFDCGFEALGEVVAVGSAVADLSVGDAVVTQSYGAFSEFQAVPRRHAKKAPSMSKEWLPLDLSATTASIALEEVLRPRAGERAVVTAAAGGTGQFAAQLLKSVYGCSVVGTCSSDDKAAFLARLGCDEAINYRACGNGGENPTTRTSVANAVAREFRRVYPKGVNIAYESVGGDLFEALVESLALRARILSIGSISVYSGDGSNTTSAKPLQLRLLSHSASLHTFFLPHFAKHAGQHFDRLCGLAEKGVITSHVDPVEFTGLEGVCDAIDRMYGRKNEGKIIVKL